MLVAVAFNDAFAVERTHPLLGCISLGRSSCDLVATSDRRHCLAPWLVAPGSRAAWRSKNPSLDDEQDPMSDALSRAWVEGAPESSGDGGPWIVEILKREDFGDHWRVLRPD